MNGTETETAGLYLLPRALSAREARRWVTGRLTTFGLDPLCDAVELLTVEVVTNALLHANTPLTLRLRREATGVHLEVRDGSTVPPHRQHFSPTSTTGRGVRLLDDLADQWGWWAESDGKTVWFQVLQARATWTVSDLAQFTDL